MISIFIDGQAGTTGLELSERLAHRSDIELLGISPERRKDPRARRELFEAADIAVLCLPDDAAREAVELAAGACRIIDASSAHRTAAGWCYGLPELHSGQRAEIAAAERVSNPGCYPQGFILMVRPLIEAGILPAGLPLMVHALSGYSGGGRDLIERHRAFDAREIEARAAEPYSLGLSHKHVPEMTHYSKTAVDPLFAPTVGHFYRGMLVQLPLFTSALAKGAGPDTLRNVLAERYADEPFVRVWETGAAAALADGFLSPGACNHSNRIDLLVFGNARQVLLVARYDNLGKGAAGAAVQNLNLMLDAPEATGLTA